nr:hypothetical protein [Tanacetum cinerariifolium]
RVRRRRWRVRRGWPPGWRAGSRSGVPACGAPGPGPGRSGSPRWPACYTGSAVRSGPAARAGGLRRPGARLRRSFPAGAPRPPRVPGAAR